MNNFLKNAVLNSKDNLMKKSIITHLSDSVKEVQYAGVSGGIEDVKDDNINEASSDLCTAIEAVFLHGLKDSLTRRFRRAIADIDERPEPSFWPPLLVISHKQIINQIEGLTQITSEVGRCRAWIRLALNDCLLSSYLLTMRQEPSTLKSYYKTSALIRDSEMLEVAQRLIEGVEQFKSFSLPCNSSLLNTWPLPSLFLAGIWAPTMKTCPVAPCDDVAQVIEEKSSHNDNSETCSLNSAMSIASQASSNLHQMVPLNEDEALKIILAKDSRDKLTQNEDVNKSSSEIEISESEGKSSDSENINYQLGNSLGKRTGWSFDESQLDERRGEIKEVVAVGTADPKSPMDSSFNALIESYNILSGGYIRTPDLREVWQKFEENHLMNNSSTPIDDRLQSASTSTSSNQTSPKIESISLAAQIGRIAQEKGLDVQNYKCADCKQSIEISPKPKTCFFTGDYFCRLCMSEELITIPARIIHNWDFKLYPVSKKSLNYLKEVKDHPTIDFKTVNPFIYGMVEEMAQLQILRNQLNFLRAYLYTCREPIIEQLQKQMWPREYMYEHVHQYSISDLMEIQSGVLREHLESVVSFGKEHVVSCWLCSQKGFLCEVCNNPKALFPFDVENVYRCDVCNAVYHKGCLNASEPCPKCERKKKREDLPLLGVTI